MRSHIYDEFIDQNSENISDLYFINLKDIAPLRSRSYEDGQVVMLKWKGKEQWLIVR